MGEFDETKVFLGKIRIFSESIFTPIFCVFSKILVQNEDIISLSVCKNIEASFTASENEVLPVKRTKSWHVLDVLLTRLQVPKSSMDL